MLFPDTTGFMPLVLSSTSACLNGPGLAPKPSLSASAIWNDPTFWLSFRNTLASLFVGGFFVFFLAFLYTILINSGIWGKKLFRLVFFLPNVVSIAALLAMWVYTRCSRANLQRR
ncbi:MAG: hypothetical protein OIF56_15165 [Cohaesibacter sp.]|nr:hypothetical protein [Cohaesibacter sp.]MCV6603368.1 hypothetical protein [Cohaesibacter sp.]